MIIIENAKYIKITEDGVDKNVAVQCVYEGVNMSITIRPNSHRYQEIMRQVDAGALTIADAD